MKPHGPAIRAIREARQISIRQLAERSGLNRGYLSRLESGLAGASGETIARIATTLDVPSEAISYEIPQASRTTIRRIVKLLGSSVDEIEAEQVSA